MKHERVLCRPGHYHSLISKKCEVCPQGYYQFRSGRSQCHKCPHGYTTFSNKSVHPTSCFVNCPPGKEYSSDGSCVPCKRGFFKKPNDVVCRPCDPAYTTESIGSISCTLPNCKQGHYLNQQLMQCLNCSYGYYQDAVGGNFCKLCPSGTTTTILGAKSIESCISTNQCESGEHKCHWLALCIDLPDKENKPMYSCRCQPGFVGNGFTCSDICLNLCYNNAKCIKTVHGKPRCICTSGYRGLRCQIKE